METRTVNKSFTEHFSDAYASARDAVKNHPKTALAAGAALAGAAAYAINPNLLALKSTDYGWIFNETSPTLVGRAINLISWQSNNSTYELSTFYKDSIISTQTLLTSLMGVAITSAIIPTLIFAATGAAIGVGSVKLTDLVLSNYF